MKRGLSTNIEQLETLADSPSPEYRFLHIRLSPAEDHVRDLESSPVSTAPSVNIPTLTPPVASVSYSIPISPMSKPYSSQVGAASQTPTTPRISTAIPHPNVSALASYSSSLPPSRIPNAILSRPVTDKQFLRGVLPIQMSQLRKIHAVSFLRTPQLHTPLYDTTSVHRPTTLDHCEP